MTSFAGNQKDRSCRREMKDKKVFLWLSLTVPGMLFVLFVVSCISIGTGVQEIVDEARMARPGDRIEALIHLVESEHLPAAKRNRAVWALGQLGDSRALPFLRNQNRKREADPLLSLSRHELEKAIHLCEGGWNITAWTWRRFVK